MRQITDRDPAAAPAVVQRNPEDAFVAGVKQNIELTKRSIEEGKTPGTLAIVSGSESARNLWQKILDGAKSSLKAISVFSFHEDLPVNQAFGVLLLWQRLRDAADRPRGTLAAFVFGSGTRSTPFTETDNAQKPAIVTPVRGMSDGKESYLTMVELAMCYFMPVQQYLTRSGFEGLIIKWGDEVQIPTCDLSGQKPELFGNADIVRFVSIQEMTTASASNKDWVGVNAKKEVTAFIPRRPLADMEKLGACPRINLQRLFGSCLAVRFVVKSDVACTLQRKRRLTPMRVAPQGPFRTHNAATSPG